ncbi:uncharacterized protein LOC134827948 isoform X1 [Culicoides brevitarsis]|uniref:uncharacterized protein LOC134827948 isoform X1 n=1 Tax=Culicoides brevitarsis TaxID=469753 RepID=UPI00307B4F6F
MGSNLKLIEAYKNVESFIKEIGNTVFNDDTPIAKQKLASRSICLILLKKMESEMLQGRFLELKNDFIRSGARQTEIVDPTIECLEKLFCENGFFVYTYVANLMIMLMRRVALGIEYVGNQNAEKILDLYAEVSKTFYQKDFNNFQKAFEGLIDNGVSIVDFIYVQTHQYLSYHYRYQGPKQYGIFMMTKYMKLRFQFHMYSEIENILVRLCLLIVHAIEFDLCMFKQARHLISVVHTHIKRIEEHKDESLDSFKLKLLKQIKFIVESLYLAVNLQKSYENMIKKADIHDFFDKYEKFKDDEIEDIDLPIRFARNDVEMRVLYKKLCEMNSMINDHTLLTIYNKIKVACQQ